MKLPELMRAVGDVAQTGGTAAQCEGLAREAGRLADMVGWASGPIDPQGQLLERLATLQEDLDVRHAQSSDAGIAMLHDALTVLGRAIARHDEQLDPESAGEDEGEDFA
ncbi:hypothetical protein SCL_2414 [Sulfuricaulis limicola]|uniref:Uncharacterized protein n=1 Tax=Sulfuricaulis limicola TaxID=1620215 RepID=A0A1B4XIS4_9GAMM|nr:hypothetical protein [Sulfuricaulis limicola]BAV34691.1 hypothetical protein SCL_2414 [Sulfuricaulis limicola]